MSFETHLTLFIISYHDLMVGCEYHELAWKTAVWISATLLIIHRWNAMSSKQHNCNICVNYPFKKGLQMEQDAS